MTQQAHLKRIPEPDNMAESSSATTRPPIQETGNSSAPCVQVESQTTKPPPSPFMNESLTLPEQPVGMAPATVPPIPPMTMAQAQVSMPD